MAVFAADTLSTEARSGGSGAGDTAGCWGLLGLRAAGCWQLATMPRAQAAWSVGGQRFAQVGGTRAGRLAWEHSGRQASDQTQYTGQARAV